MACPQYITNIAPTEKIGNSLIKLNNNFVNLNEALCTIKNKFDSTVVVRTFFYYGPNSGTTPTSDMQDEVASYPSNSTIEQFVNGPDPSYLNLPSISKENDQVYVIYQKTGVSLSTSNRVTTNAYNIRVISRYVRRTITIKTPDEHAIYSPLFVIWKLVLQPTETSSLIYKVQSGYPKFTQAETISTNDWANPGVWSEF